MKLINQTAKFSSEKGKYQAIFFTYNVAWYQSAGTGEQVYGNVSPVSFDILQSGTEKI